jgi:cation diffusion facilitator family transporter
VTITPTNLNTADEAARTERGRAKQQAALSSIGAEVVLLLGKLVIGLLTGSLGLLSEALHSGLDLVGSILSYAAVRVSGLPPDRNHPYGHGRSESLVALFAVVLLSGTALGILYEAYQRILVKDEVPETTIWGFLVLIAALAIDVTRSRMLGRVARETNSQALAADAAHFASDLWSSGTVLLSLTLIWLGGLLNWPRHWLSVADAAAGVIVALVIFRVAWELGHRSVTSLMDQVEPQLMEEVQRAACAAEGVVSTESARVRYAGDRAYADVIVDVARGLSVEESDAISEDVIGRVRQLIPGADVVVHTHPVQSETERATDSARVVAARLGVSIHHVRAFQTPAGLRLDMHMEVPASQTLTQAHALTEQFETHLCREVPGLAAVEAHIEPRHDEAEVVLPVTDATMAELITRAASRIAGRAVVGPVQIGQGPHGYVVTLHVTLPGDLPITEAHTRTAEIEQAVRAALPAAYRVTVHPEPSVEVGGQGLVFTN